MKFIIQSPVDKTIIRDDVQKERFFSEDDPHARQKLIDWWDQDKIENARVLVIGAGAIGNETLKNLALLGFRNILICDMDTIEASNLSRTVLFGRRDVGKYKARAAAQRTMELALARDAKIDYFIGDIITELGSGVYRYFDIILGCLDNNKTRYHVDNMCAQVGKIWINAGIKELALSVEIYDSSTSACYHCYKPESTSLERDPCLEYKKRKAEAGKVATVQIASAIVSALQVQEAVKVITGKGAAIGQKLFFQGTTNEYEKINLRVNPECMHPYLKINDVIECEQLSNRITLRSFLRYVSKKANSGKNATIILDRTFIAYERCKQCGKIIKIFKPSDVLYDDEIYCSECNPNGYNSCVIVKDVLKLHEITVDTPSEILDLTLEAIGIPKLHIVCVRDENGEHKYYELTGDKSRLMPKIFGKK